jgi:hypothetical protein
MAQIPAGKPRKGKNFSSDEERSLCRSFLAVSQDPICGNGQRNSAFWDRITAHFNQSKPRSNPVRPSRSLETKWGHIKHDVGKFCGAYKQVFDCRESGTSLEDVVEKTLQFYQDRHPKQQAFAYLHCWHVLKDVPRWWDSPVDVQRRSLAAEISPKNQRKNPSSYSSSSSSLCNALSIDSWSSFLHASIRTHYYENHNYNTKGTNYERKKELRESIC